MAPFRDKWVRRFVINETTRHKRGFTVYKVTSMIFLKSSPDTASKVSVWKRYNDFKKLHADLKAVYQTLQIRESYPPFAKPTFFGRFEAEVIEERRECAIKFLEFIARHSSLFTNDIFINFFETSLGDDNYGDCSLSVSSDTSEEDKATIREKLDEKQDVRQCRTNAANLQNAGRVSGKRNVIIEGVIPIEIEHLLDRPIITKEPNEESPMLNNNIDKNNEDTSWQQFVSNKKFLEQDKENLPQFSESSLPIYDGLDFSDTRQDSGQYILIAAAHMSAGFRHEAIAEYEEAYMQYKLAISNLCQGVQKDPDIARTASIKEKITKYSERADRLYNRHLNCNISMISKPVGELKYYKVLRVMGSVMLVNDVKRQTTRIIKTVEKPAGSQEDINKYILRGKVPYMVQLHACVQTETTVFLILEYASGGKLWDFLKKEYGTCRGKVLRKKMHGRSMSCEAIINIDSEKRMNTSLDRSQKARTREEKEIIVPNFEISQLTESTMSVEIRTEKCFTKSEEDSEVSVNLDMNIPTTKLLEKAQELLKSVDATIKRSNSIATRLNESGRLLYETETIEASKDDDNTEESGDTSELSISETDLSTESEKNHVTTEITSPTSGQCVHNGVYEKLDNERAYLFDRNLSYELACHDEDSGIEMEQELWRIPEIILKNWAAQMLLTLEALHQQEVVISDLRPDNLLLDGNGRILFSYIVPRQSPAFSSYHKPYTAPELCMYLPVVPATPAADVWSLGVILYELFTGIPFQSRHPGPFHSHSIISIPNELSEDAKTLLTEILKFEPSERLSIPEIKQLSFFEKTDWLSLLNA